ncbi:hypothetical protein B9Z55_022021 [Caenorhabditis nigoni]|nr:hypothetical protein B9Z55_022021 [Caenorhabditis nigoni]
MIASSFERAWDIEGSLDSVRSLPFRVSAIRIINCDFDRNPFHYRLGLRRTSFSSIQEQCSVPGDESQGPVDH